MKFSNRSSLKIDTCHEKIQLLLNEAIKTSPIDFGISHGHRTPEEQKALFDKGRTAKGVIVTNCDGYRILSKHNHSPSIAFDVFCWPRDIMYNEQSLTIVAGHILLTAQRLGINLQWGGLWKFKDLPHFELRKDYI